MMSNTPRFRQRLRGAQQGRSDLGKDAYHGPCPAKGDAPHRYVFIARYGR